MNLKADTRISNNSDSHAYPFTLKCLQREFLPNSLFLIEYLYYPKSLEPRIHES